MKDVKKYAKSPSNTRKKLINKKYKVYFLLDPESERIMYVGVTSQPLSIRLLQHINKATNNRHPDNTLKSQWIRETIKKNNNPIIILIKEYNNKKEALKQEQRQIKTLLSINFKLLNEVTYECQTDAI